MVRSPLARRIPGDEQLNAVDRQEAFGMKLHAVQRPAAMTYAHDLAAAVGGVGPGIDVELARQRGRIDDEAVVPRGLDGTLQSGEQAAAGMLDRIDSLVFTIPLAFAMLSWLLIPAPR